MMNSGNGKQSYDSSLSLQGVDGEKEEASATDEGEHEGELQPKHY